MYYFKRARCFYEGEILSRGVVSSFIAVFVNELHSYTTFRILNVNYLTVHNLQVNGHDYT